MHYNHLDEKLLTVKLSCRSSLELVSAKVAANAPPSRSVMRSCGRNEERSERERGNTCARMHSLPPSLSPSLRPRSRTARPRGAATSSHSRRRRRRSRPAGRAASSEFPPPSCPSAVLPLLHLSPFGVVRFPLVRSLCCHFGGAGRRRAGRYERASRLRSRFSTFSPSLPLLWLRNRDVVAGKRFPFSGNEAWDLEQYKLVVLVNLYFNPSYH